MLRALLLAALLLPVASLAPDASGAPAAVPGRLVVTLDAIPAGLSPGDWYEGARVVRVDESGHFVVLQHPDARRAARDLPGKPHVRAVESDEPRPMLLAFTPNDPSFGTQYALPLVRAPQAWELGTGGDQASVCVVDTGIRTTHQDLAAAYAGGADFVSNDVDPWDDNGHGTHVAGIAAARIGNALNVAGIANVPLYAVKVLDATGSGTSSAVASGIIWCADHAGPRTVINLSLGSDAPSVTIASAVTYAIAQGALVVAAAGNDGLDIDYPAALPGVVAVTCTTILDALCSFSSRGADAEIAAPGSLILSTASTSDTAVTFKSGTSMSSPLVAGAAALYWAQNPTDTAAEVRARLRATAEDLGAAGHDTMFGYGRLDVACLVSDVLCPDYPGSADLSITAALAPGPIIVNQPVTLAVNVTNHGPDALLAGSLTGTIPSSVTTTGGLPDGCARASLTVTCALDPLAAGATQLLDFVLTPTAITTTSITFSATSMVPDPTTPNRVTVPLVATAAKADLRVAQDVSTTSLLAGLPVTTNITVTNAGPQPSPAGTLRLPIPRGTTVTVPATCAATTTTLSCPTGELAPGATATFAITAVPTLAGSASLAPAVAGTIVDPLLTNNRAAATVTVLRPTADIGVTIAGPAAAAVVGREGDYRITVRNDGPQHAPGVRLMVSLPVVAQWDTTGLPAACVLVRSSVTCALGTMLDGETVTVTLPSVIARSGSGTLSARVTTTGLDLVTTGNAATLAFTVPRTTADVAVGATAPPEGFHVATLATTSLAITNAGPGNASLVQLTVTFPAGITWTPPDGCRLAGTTALVCTLGVVLAGETRTVDLPGVPSRLLAGTLTARVTTSSLDPNVGNGAATLQVVATVL